MLIKTDSPYIALPLAVSNRLYTVGLLDHSDHSDIRFCKYRELLNIRTKRTFKESWKTFLPSPHGLNHEGDQFNGVSSKEGSLRELPYLQLFVLISPQH